MATHIHSTFQNVCFLSLRNEQFRVSSFFPSECYCMLWYKEKCISNLSEKLQGWTGKAWLDSLAFFGCMFYFWSYFWNLGNYSNANVRAFNSSEKVPYRRRHIKELQKISISPCIFVKLEPMSLLRQTIVFFLCYLLQFLTKQINILTSWMQASTLTNIAWREGQDNVLGLSGAWKYHEKNTN